jgi:hypothetical protein
VCNIPGNPEAVAAASELLGIDENATFRATGASSYGSELWKGGGGDPNDDGYVCPEGTEWEDETKEWCVDGNGGLWFPVVVITEEGDDGWGGIGDGSDEDPWPTDDDPYTPPSDCITAGPGQPCLPGGSGDSQPTDPDEQPDECTTDDPRFNTPEFRSFASAIMEESNADAADVANRQETVAYWIPPNGSRTMWHAVFHPEPYISRTPLNFEIIPLVGLPEGTLFVHTHPFSVDDDLTVDGDLVEYVPRPSADDLRLMSNTRYREGVFIDRDGVFVFGLDGTPTKVMDRCDNYKL